MLPAFYQTHFQQQLSRVQYIVFTLLLALISEHRQVKLEALADVFPLSIKARKSSPQTAKISGAAAVHVWEYVVSDSRLLVGNLSSILGLEPPAPPSTVPAIAEGFKSNLSPQQD